MNLLSRVSFVYTVRKSRSRWTCRWFKRMPRVVKSRGLHGYMSTPGIPFVPFQGDCQKRREWGGR